MSASRQNYADTSSLRSGFLFLLRATVDMLTLVPRTVSQFTLTVVR